MDRFEHALNRVLNELRYAISMRNTHNVLVEAAPHTSWGFFSFVEIALFNDMIAHAIKVLDQHKDVSSFWYLQKTNEKLVNKAIRAHNIDIGQIAKTAKSLKHIRDKTHFHIDKRAVTNVSEVWSEANISGEQFNYAIDSLWLILQQVYFEYVGSKYIQPIYNGEEAAKIVSIAREKNIKV